MRSSGQGVEGCMRARIATIRCAAYASSMRNRLRAMGTIVMGFGLAACGSETPKTCTLIGCQDEFAALVRTADGYLPSGMHRVELLVDGVTLMCTFKVPLEAAPGGGLV